LIKVLVQIVSVSSPRSVSFAEGFKDANYIIGELFVASGGTLRRTEFLRYFKLLAPRLVRE